MEKHLFIQYWSIAPAVKLFQHNLANATIVYGCATNPTYLKMATDFKIKMIQQLFRSLNNRKNFHTLMGVMLYCAYGIVEDSKSF